MKKTLFVIASLFIVFSCFVCNAASIENIKKKGFIEAVTNAEFEPFTYREGDEFFGIDIDISKKIAQSLGVKLKINDVSFDALILELAGKRCDFGIGGMSSSEEKEKSVDFSIPYYRSKQKIVVLNSGNIKNENDLESKKIGVQLGSTGDLYCSENIKNASITRYGKISDGAIDLKNNSIDAIVVDDLPAEKILKILGSSAKILDETLFEEDYKIAVPKGEKELLNHINSVLKSMSENGEVDEIIKNNLKSSNHSENSFASQIYNNLFNKERYKLILGGLGVTLEITMVALLIGIVLGIVVALIRVNSENNLLSKILKFLAGAYVLIIRGTPVVVQLFVIHYIILSSSGLNKIFVAMITFGINSGAYVSEIIRSGILSIDKGQYEAGRSLGLSNSVTLRKIILPQAFKNILPTLMSEFIQLIKETSVAGFIGIVDLSKAGDVIRSITYQPTVPLLTVACVYLLLVSVLTWFLSIMERRLKVSDRS